MELITHPTKMVGKYLRKLTETLHLMCYIKQKNKMCPAHILKYNSTLQKQFILLLIPYGKGWHSLAVAKLPALLRGVT